LAAVEEEQERMEVPGPPGMLVEVRAHASWVELVAVARSTVPVKPLSEAIVIVELPATRTSTVELVGFAVTVKSGEPGAVTVTASVVDCIADPLVPVSVTV